MLWRGYRAYWQTLFETPARGCIIHNIERERKRAALLRDSDGEFPGCRWAGIFPETLYRLLRGVAFTMNDGEKSDGRKNDYRREICGMCVIYVTIRRRDSTAFFYFPRKNFCSL